MLKMSHDSRFQSRQAPLPPLLPLVIMIGRGRDVADKQAAKKHDGDPPPDSPMPGGGRTWLFALGGLVFLGGERGAPGKGAGRAGRARPAPHPRGGPRSARGMTSRPTAGAQTN